MKRYQITSVIFLLVFGVLAFSNARGQATDNITVSTDVFAALSVTVDQDLQFGGVADGSTPELDPTNSANNTDVGASAQVGEATINGGNNAQIVIDLDQTSYTLMSSSNYNPGPTYTPWLVGNSSDSRSGSTDIYNSSGTDQNPSISTNGSGNYYLFLGGNLGTIDVSSYTDGSDTYSATATISVSYN